MKGGSDGTRRTSASSGATAGLTSLRSNTVLICGRDGDDSGPAFAAARDWASSNDARFRIATERGIRGPLLEAAKRLLPLRNAPVDVVLAELAITFARDHATSFGQLVDVLPASREASLAVVWRLIARGALVVDLTKPITAETQVMSAPGLSM